MKKVKNGRTEHRVHHDLNHKVYIERVENKGDIGDAFACVHGGDDRPEDVKEQMLGGPKDKECIHRLSLY